MPFPRPVSTLLALACLAFPAALPALELPIPSSGYDEEWAKSFDVDIKRGGGSHDDRLKAILTGSSVPANILHAGEQPTLTLQLQNLSDQVISGAAVVKLVRYELFTVPGQDMFHVAPRKLADAGETAITVQIPAKGFQDLEVKLRVPDTFGGYAILVQLAGRKPLLVGGMVRSLAPDAPRDPRFRRLAIDLEDPIAISRLGAAPNRVGMSPISHDGEDASYESEYQRVAAIIKDLHAHQLPVTMEFGHGVPGTGKIHALGRGRHHLAQKTKAGEPRPYGSLSAEESDGKAYETNDYSDLAWQPSFDPVVKKNIKRLLKEFAWPKGPIIAVDLWNEPWNGASISGWMSDDQRYREIFTVMAQAVEEVRKEDKAEVWIMSCDSSSNSFDKLFPGDDQDMLKWNDISSIHYQNTEPVTTVKAWLDRKHPDGTPNPTRVWDTESWVANSDGRIASVLPTNFAMGIERAVGIWSNWGRSVLCMESKPTVRTAQGEKQAHITNAWSVAAAVGAMQHFIGNRPFDRVLWQGLPFVYRFAGYADKPDEGCIVVVGDIEAVFGFGRVPFFTVKSQAEIVAKQDLHAKLATFAPGSAERSAAEKTWRTRSPFTGVTLSLPDRGGVFRLHDYHGNRISATNGKLVVPVDDRGFYLATDGSAGSFAALTTAVERARLDGLMPVQVVAHDPTAAVGKGGLVRLVLRNLLERPVTGTLKVTVGALGVQVPATVSLAPREAKEIAVALSGQADPSNAYALSVRFDAAGDGLALHDEVVRCNVIAKRAITVDGKLDEWQGVLPQTITSDGTVDRTDAEAAWWPGKPYTPTAKKGLATAWLAYDEHGMHVALRIADERQAKGMIRFATRDDDASFWPETVHPLKYEQKDDKWVEVGVGDPITWPTGVRRHTYATWPTLPFGDGIDSVQIGFNVRAEDDKPWYAYPKGTYRQFTGYWDTDYEYSLHAVRADKGGGTEIFRLGHPDLPHKHFFDHSPKSKAEGAVEDGKLVIVHQGTVRIVECTIPWRELPLVKRALDEGRPAKFTFRVNDDAGVGCLELPVNRSVSRLNAKALKPDWTVHWANEIAFGWER